MPLADERQMRVFSGPVVQSQRCVRQVRLPGFYAANREQYVAAPGVRLYNLVLSRGKLAAGDSKCEWDVGSRLSESRDCCKREGRRYREPS